MLHNINNWNGTWYCPFCKAPVGSPSCSCGISYMDVNDPNIGREIVFYEYNSLRVYPYAQTPSYMANVKKILAISENGIIGREVAIKNVFKVSEIKKMER